MKSDIFGKVDFTQDVQSLTKDKAEEKTGVPF
jgi:hypothetical protein